MRNLLLLNIALFWATLSFAQSFELGLQAGTAFYKGEIEVNASNVFKQSSFAGGFISRYNFTNRLAIKTQYFRGNLYANEKQYPTSDYREKRGFSFDTQFSEWSGQVEFKLLNIDRDFYIENDDPFMSLYGYAGIGKTYFKPTTDYNEIGNSPVDATADKLASYAKNSVLVPMGMGIKFRVLDGLYMGGEFGLRKTFTDYIDGVSLSTNTAGSKDYYIISGIYAVWNFSSSNGNGIGSWGAAGGKRRIGGCPTF